MKIVGVFQLWVVVALMVVGVQAAGKGTPGVPDVARGGGGDDPAPQPAPMPNSSPSGPPPAKKRRRERPDDYPDLSIAPLPGRARHVSMELPDIRGAPARLGTVSDYQEFSIWRRSLGGAVFDKQGYMKPSFLQGLVAGGCKWLPEMRGEAVQAVMDKRREAANLELDKKMVAERAEYIRDHKKRFGYTTAEAMALWKGVKRDRRKVLETEMYTDLDECRDRLSRMYYYFFSTATEFCGFGGSGDSRGSDSDEDGLDGDSGSGSGGSGGGGSPLVA